MAEALQLLVEAFKKYPLPKKRALTEFLPNTPYLIVHVNGVLSNFLHHEISFDAVYASFDGVYVCVLQKSSPISSVTLDWIPIEEFLSLFMLIGDRLGTFYGKLVRLFCGLSARYIFISHSNNNNKTS